MSGEERRVDAALQPIPSEGLTSPDANYVLRTNPWEARMSLWVFPPQLRALATGRELLRFRNPAWSAEAARWVGDARLVLQLRRFPGAHVPSVLNVEVDAATERARLDGATVPLDELERILDRAIRVR